MTPTFHTFKWNGYKVEAEAYINYGNDVEFDSIRIYNDKDEEIDTVELLGILTPVTRSNHVKDPIAELSDLFLEAEHEYLCERQDPIRL